MQKKKTEKHFLQKPQYPGGQAALKAFVAQNLQYPDSAKPEQVSGTVRIKYTVNHKGVVTETKVLSGLGYGCDEEACRVVRLLKFEVGKNRGLRAVFHKTINIHFHAPKVAPTPPDSGMQIQYHYVTKQAATKGPEQQVEEKKRTGYSYVVDLG